MRDHLVQAWGPSLRDSFGIDLQMTCQARQNPNIPFTAGIWFSVENTNTG